MAWFGRGPTDDIKTALEHLTAGDYSVRVPPFDNAAHDTLGRRVNELAVHIQTNFQKLSKENAHLTAVVSNMTEGVVAVDPQGYVIIVNPALAAIFNVDTNAARGRLLLEAIRHSQLNDLAQHVLNESTAKTAEIYVFSFQDLVFEAHAVPLVYDGPHSGALIVLRDVTQLRHLEKVRRDFVANVSHELRTPLASIKGFAETLREGALDDKQNALEFVASIEKNADNMIALVQDLLDLTSIESGQQQPQIQSTSVSELVAEVALNLASIARKKNVEIKNDVPANTAVMADKKHLKQILVNLAENAIKFNEDSGWVRFSAEPAGAQLRITVTDNGPGIPAQDIARIFERFYRSDRARSREHGGTGLGLSIVKHLAEANHGSVTVGSSVGKGAQFSVFLPRVT
jgi:two-component system phosphate regulon sensor histidine kinase PhoR